MTPNHERQRRLLELFQTAYNDLLVKHWQVEEENKRLRRANAILALPRVTDEQVRETDLALRRILGFDEFGGSNARH